VHGCSVYGPNPNLSPGRAMIAPRSSFRCGFAIESIAQAIDD
jgi:hypothetical protein